jgi:antitoxin component of RelBE/YafQ-DinJ toxin-antitoxin module
MNFVLPSTIQESINHMIEKTPEYLEEALQTVDWQASVIAIGAKNNFSEDQMIIFIVLVALFLTTISNKEQFQKDLQEKMSLGGVVIQSILKDITDQVVYPIENFVLENNKEVIEYMQELTNQMKHQIHAQELSDQVGITITDSAGKPLGVPTDRVNAVSTSPMSTEIPSMSAMSSSNSLSQDSNSVSKNPADSDPATYTGHDPYHEPLE